MDPTTPYDRGMPRVVAHLPFSDNAQLVALRSGVPRKCRGAEIVPTRTLFIACFRPCKGQGGYYLTTRSGFWAARRRGDQPWPAPMQCRPATAKALARGRLATARAIPQGRLTPLAGAAARRGGACGHGRLRPTRKGDSRPRAQSLTVRRPQRGLVGGRPQGVATCGQPCRQRGWRRWP
ncbi:hypothetical protein GW17_00050928 [Ensete ventricosum]|nr:hypothetical protein GW17_00050928 [Ensete ventricosum]